MSIYRSSVTKAFSDFNSCDRLNNQVILTGNDESYSITDGVFFLEFIEVDTGTVTIKDGRGEQIATGVKEFNQEISPLRCDYGIIIEGDVSIAKGFAVFGVLDQKV